MPDNNTVGLTRRQILALTSAAAGGLAGCSGSGTKGNTGTPTDTKSQPEFGVGAEDDTATDTEAGSETAAESETATDTNQKQGPNVDPYPNPDGEPIDDVAHILNPGGFNPFEWNGNYFGENPGNGWPDLGLQRFISLRTISATAQYALVGLKDVERKSRGCEVVFTLRGDDHWWDGTPVTARDYVTHHEIEKYMQYGPNPGEKTGDRSSYPGAKVEAKDDNKIHFTRKKPAAVGRARVDPGGLATQQIAVKHDYYKEWLEKFEDATTVKENDNISNKLRGHTISIDEFVDEGLGNGLWKPVDWSDTTIRGKKHEGHARSHWTNINEIVATNYSDKQKRVQAYKTGKQDAIDPVRTPIRDSMDEVDGFQMLKDFPYFYTRGIKFNFARDHVHRRGVRRAMAYAMDHKKMLEAIRSSEGYEGYPQRYQMGLAMGSAKYYMGKDWMSRLHDYGLEADFEKAAEEMRNAGYTKESGQWVGPDGKPFDATVMGFPISRGPSEVQFFCSWMSDFGLKMKPQIITGSKFWTIMDETRDDIPEMMHLWGPGPYSNGMVAWNGSVLDSPGEISEPLRGSFEDCSNLTSENLPKPELTAEESPKYHRPVRPEMPAMSEIGYTGVELPDNTETANLIWWDRKIQAAQKLETVREYTRKLGWYYNWQLPGLDFYSESWAQAGNAKNFFWGDGSTQIEWIREVERTIHHGITQGRTEPHEGSAEGPMEPDLDV